MEILHTYLQMADWAETVVLISILAAVLFATISSLFFIDENNVLGTIFASLLVFAVAVAILVGSMGPRDTYHKAVLTDIDGFNFENFEITNVDGRVFTIKEVR